MMLTGDQRDRISRVSDQWSLLWDKRRQLWIAAEDDEDGAQIEEVDLNVLLERLADDRAPAGHRTSITAAPADATRGERGRDELTCRVFRALYVEYDLRTVHDTHVAVPKGTLWFAGQSLGDIARQISEHEYRAPAAPSTGTPTANQLPARMPPRLCSSGDLRSSSWRSHPSR
jgi:hypothetical protein